MHFSTTLVVSFLATLAPCASTQVQFRPRAGSAIGTVESSILTSATAAAGSSTTSMSPAPSTASTTSSTPPAASGIDTSSTQPATRTSNSVSVQTSGSLSARTSSQPNVGGQAGGQGSAAGGEATGNNLPFSTTTSAAGAWKAVQTARAGLLGLAIGAVGIVL